MKPNRIRQLLAEGKRPVGHMVMEFATRGIAKLTEFGGADFVLIDMEHSGLGVPDVAGLIAWYKATPITTIVRVPSIEYHFIARIMDAGAHGIMAPNVRSAEEARKVVDSMRYAPEGGRGLGLGAALNDYAPPVPRDYMTAANRDNFVICQIESQKALDNLDAIASTPGVDCLWVGHFDLTQSLGIVAEFQNPKFLDALKKVADTAKAHGQAAGIQPGSLEQAKQWIEIGYNLISFSSDTGVYRSALKSAVDGVRAI